MKSKMILLSALIFAAACNSSDPVSNPKTKLDSLKKEQAKISEQIKTLEAEIAKTDTSTKSTGTLVTVQPVQPTVFDHYIDLQGKVDADQNVGATPQIPGTFTSILVTEGDHVNKGQVLATMDGSAIWAQVEAMKKNLDFATTLYDKQKTLWDQQIGSEVQYLQAKNNKESLEKQLDALMEQYEMTKIKSPINGTVDEVMARIGEAGAPGYPAFRIVNLNSLKVKGEVSETYSALVHVGDKVKIFLPDLNREIDSKISYAAKVINQQSRTFTVESKLSGDETLKPNTIAILKILDYEKPNAVVVDVNLIQKSGDGSFVYVASDDNGRKTAQRKTVTVGKIYGGKAEITSGLNPGDALITVGYQDIVAGQEIQF